MAYFETYLPAARHRRRDMYTVSIQYMHDIAEILWTALDFEEAVAKGRAYLQEHSDVETLLMTNARTPEQIILSR
jgi:hypothetical protein